MRRVALSAAAACGLVAAAAVPAAAHPHVFVDARSEVVFAAGKLTAVRHIWQFDESFTQFAVMGLDAKSAGRVLGKRPGAVRTACYRGLRTLGSWLEANDDQ